jgi:hypothetical protein
MMSALPLIMRRLRNGEVFTLIMRVLPPMTGCLPPRMRVRA